MATEYHYFDDDIDGMPIITLEVMPDCMTETIPYDDDCHDTEQNITCEDMKDSNETGIDIDQSESPGVHFLVDKAESVETNDNVKDKSSSLLVRTDLMEYASRNDGSVCCKMCGKILASRSHWYRHKYRAHSIHSGYTAPLFQCKKCFVCFKSRKGYIGHIARKHSKPLQDASPVLTNAQSGALAKKKSKTQPNETQPERDKSAEQSDPPKPKIKSEPDPEMAIPISVVPTYKNTRIKQTKGSTETSHRKGTRCIRQSIPRSLKVLKHAKVENKIEWKERRSREEKLVADIIARVRRECEAQGAGGSARRGYSRKSGLHT